MAKSFKRDYEDVERENESPAHRNRREVTQQLKNYPTWFSEMLDEYGEEEFETFERIRPKHQKKR